MNTHLIACIEAVQSQLATTLWPESADARQETARACHRILTELLLEQSRRPALEARAVERMLGILGDLGSSGHGSPAIDDAAADLGRHLRDGGTLDSARPAVQRLAVALRGARTAATDRALHDLLAVELELGHAIESEALAHAPGQRSQTDATEALSPDRIRRLRDFLRQSFRTPALELGTIRRIPGGFSKTTRFIELSQAPGLSRTVVLRTDKEGSPIAGSVGHEYDILQTCFDAGVPVPQPFATSTDPAILGAPFLVVSKVDGDNIGDALNVLRPSVSFGTSLARTLARLHGIDPARFATSLPGAGVTTRTRMLDDLAFYEAKWRSSGQASPALEIAYAWLSEHAHLADGRRALIHRDVGCHNLLLARDEIAALLDWETAAIGNPAQDLGYVYHTVTQVMPWSAFLDAYAAAGGHVPPPDQVRYYRLWRATWLATMLEQVRSAVEGGHTRDFGLVYNSVYQYRRVHLALVELVEEVHRT